MEKYSVNIHGITVPVFAGTEEEARGEAEKKFQEAYPHMPFEMGYLISKLGDSPNFEWAKQAWERNIKIHHEIIKPSFIWMVKNGMIPKWKSPNHFTFYIGYKVGFQVETGNMIFIKRPEWGSSTTKRYEVKTWEDVLPVLEELKEFVDSLPEEYVMNHIGW